MQFCIYFISITGQLVEGLRGNWLPTPLDEQLITNENALQVSAHLGSSNRFLVYYYFKALTSS